MSKKKESASKQATKSSLLWKSFLVQRPDVLCRPIFFLIEDPRKACLEKRRLRKKDFRKDYFGKICDDTWKTLTVNVMCKAGLC